MRVLGISGRYRDAAAALCVDGQVVAAASEDSFTRIPGVGYAQTGGFPTQAAGACVEAAGISLDDIDEVAVVEDMDAEALDDRAEVRRAVRSGQIRTIDAVHADAAQAGGFARAAGAVLVCGVEPPTMAAFFREGDHLKRDGRISGGDGLLAAAGVLARSLGVAGPDPYQALDRLSVGAEPEFSDRMAGVMAWTDHGEHRGVSVDGERLTALVTDAGGDDAARLSDASSVNVRLQERRRALAASFTCQLAHVVRDATVSLCAGSSPESVAFGGAMFANPRFTTELRQLIGDSLALAVVPEQAGRALGAVLATATSAPTAWPALALGPTFSDADIKRTLDNCRLDYVYEPDWTRLHVRVSGLLAQGKVIGWFQGAMAFGPRALGTRSILCDPSGRYARHNMNEYLRQKPLDEPLPVVFAPSVAADCLARPVASPLTVMDAAVNPAWRERLTSALDWRHCVRVQTVSAVQAPRLCELLECHYRRTGVPALIETNLSEPGQPVACTPRDAVRTVYSSAIDALVLGRFVLMKDHWLLRNHAD